MEVLELLSAEHRALLLAAEALDEIPAWRAVERDRRARALRARARAVRLVERHFFLPEAALEGIPGHRPSWQAIDALLGKLRPEDPRGSWGAYLRGARLLLARHADDEETAIFPMFAKRVSPRRRAHLGREVEAALRLLTDV